MNRNSDTRQNAAATESKRPEQFSKTTQKMLVLRHLHSADITQAEAARLYNCWRLAHWIHVLRNDGYKILTIDEPNSSRSGTHARYVLMSEPTPPTAA